MKYIKERVDNRIPVRLPGYLNLKYKTYGVSIKNISKHGLGLVFLSIPTPLIFDAESNLEVELLISPDEKLTLSGNKKWFSPRNNPYKEIGMEISSPSLKYIKFVETQSQTFR